MFHYYAGTREDILKKTLEEYKNELSSLRKKSQEDARPHMLRQYNLECSRILILIEQVEDEIEEILMRGLHKGHESMPQDCFLRTSEKYECLGLQDDGRIYWRDEEDYYYSWDGKSREVEKFNNTKERGHLGSLRVDGSSTNKFPVKGREAKNVKRRC